MSASCTTIVVASHKPYWMPGSPMYLPVQVGAAGNESIPGFQRDDEGDNISVRNPRYSELTGLYWGWKNLRADYLGLAHYRRHFAGTGERGVVCESDLAPMLRRTPVVLPKRRNYYIESVGSHYAHTFDPLHLEIVRLALDQVAPEYVQGFDSHLKRRSSHILNMMIMRADLLNEYCTWLFETLSLVDAAIDYTGMTAFQARAVGRLAERLLDPWLDYNGVPYVELPIANMEKVDWVKKGGAFLAAKFLGTRYEDSF